MYRSFRAAVLAARREKSLYFAALLSQQRILEAMGPARAVWRGWIYTPAITVWVYLSQCLSADHSCREAVARLAAWRAAQGVAPCSPDTGAYCTARSHFSEGFCKRLVCQTGKELEEQAPPEWLWLQRRVRVVDGSTITMPDTPENQDCYPQEKNQRPGCGFPIARILVVFSLSVGSVLDAAIGKYEGQQTGENCMFRRLHDSLESGDVVVADRAFSGWWDIAFLQERGVDVVVRKHQLRATDFRQGTRLGSGDHLVCWEKPQRRPWLSPEERARLPEKLVLREVRVQVQQEGFRTRSLVVVTTL